MDGSQAACQHALSSERQVTGEHHYPWPAMSGDFVRCNGSQLWVTPSDNTQAAVTPLQPRGSGDGRVRLLGARHGAP